MKPLVEAASLDFIKDIVRFSKPLCFPMEVGMNLARSVGLIKKQTLTVFGYSLMNLNWNMNLESDIF